MNPALTRVQPYPFEKLAALTAPVTPPAEFSPIVLAIGEPQHPAPDLIHDALVRQLPSLSRYPSTRGLPQLRSTICQWLSRRFQLPDAAVNPDTQVLPVAGTREALFAFAQALLDPAERALVVMPNPFYQIYEGAALLAGASPYFVNATAVGGFLPDFTTVPEGIWRRCRLLYICTPSNPSGGVMSITAMQQLLELADRFDFVIASDECYSELYQDESHPPPGLLEAAWAAGRHGFERCVVFHSLSKRSNAPGLRSGFVAGDATLLQPFFRYRTYHGCALPVTTQYASVAAWSDEAHVRDNRAQYRAKFAAVAQILQDCLQFDVPTAGFYLWPRTPIADPEFARRLYAEQNVTVLPGSFLSRQAHGEDPGANHVRIALVAPLAECITAAQRIHQFIQSL